MLKQTLVQHMLCPLLQPKSLPLWDIPPTVQDTPFFSMIILYVKTQN